MVLSHTGAFNLLCGELLGSGIHRKVFACKVDPSLVVKVETDEEFRTFANFTEHKNWTENELYKPVADWLAPVVAISPCGLVSLQKRILPVRPGELPAEVPAFLTDLKAENFGLYEGRVVACDYTFLITNISVRKKKANWS
jgi:hypothetical protein